MESGSTTILCVMRSRRIAGRIAMELSKRGFRVIVMHNARSGVAAVIEVRPDLVLADVWLPDMSGFDLRNRTAAIARRFRSLPFVFVTGGGNGDGALKAQRLKSDEYVASPLNFDLLRATISMRLARAKRSSRGSGGTDLNQRELDALTWSARGMTSAEIARMLELSKRTVDFYLDSAKAKLGAGNRIEAAVTAATKRLIKP
jgi:DNA-binding NarL/FixJ family response regulator